MCGTWHICLLQMSQDSWMCTFFSAWLKNTVYEKELMLLFKIWRYGGIKCKIKYIIVMVSQSLLWRLNKCFEHLFVAACFWYPVRKIAYLDLWILKHGKSDNHHSGTHYEAKWTSWGVSSGHHGHDDHHRHDYRRGQPSGHHLHSTNLPSADHDKYLHHVVGMCWPYNGGAGGATGCHDCCDRGMATG